MSDSEYHEVEQSGPLAVPYDPPKTLSLLQNLCPVTILQVLHAEFLAESIVIEGSCFSNVALAAHVISVGKTATHMYFNLEDGTGRIRAEKRFDKKTLQQLSGEINNWEVTRCTAFEHTYVMVTGAPQKFSNFLKIEVNSIQLAPYVQVLHHILNVIHTSMLPQPPVETCSSDKNLESNEVISTLHNMPQIASVAMADDHDSLAMAGYQSEGNTQPRHAPLREVEVLPNTFSPRRHQPYATLGPLERAIMKYMRRHQDRSILIKELAQAIQASCGYTQHDVELAIQSLLLEAYVTSPLDDGYVVITPRY